MQGCMIFSGPTDDQQSRWGHDGTSPGTPTHSSWEHHGALLLTSPRHRNGSSVARDAQKAVVSNAHGCCCQRIHLHGGGLGQ
jgi:hypothetical protein